MNEKKTPGLTSSWPRLIWLRIHLAAIFAFGLVPAKSQAAENVYLTEVPDYSWHLGCFGTACGNLMGYWDRHGLPNFYKGPTAGGVAPLNDHSTNRGIHSLWASAAGVDGRPANKPGHREDYYIEYEGTSEDPYVTAGRPEHEPDCIGDFIGLSQRKWRSLNGECDGNIDAYSFTYWDNSGARRVNYQPGAEAGSPAIDIPSGMRQFAAWRGYASDGFSQLTDFNPNVPNGKGFTFEDLKREIDAGYPVLLFMQYYDVLSRELEGMPNANPNLHGMLAYGYFVTATGRRLVRFRTSWASGDSQLHEWIQDWQVARDLPVKGVMGFRPMPAIVHAVQNGSSFELAWHGPRSERYDAIADTRTWVHRYVVESSPSLNPPAFKPVTDPITDLQASISNCCDGTAFFRVRLLE